jgi:glutathione S-transferase
MPHFTAIVTLLALLLYFWTTVRVGRARGKFGIKAPATTGNPDFEREFRVQANMLEWLPIFLPAIWLAAIYVNDMLAAVVGLVWVGGRALYIQSYSEAADKRHFSFGIQAIAAGALWTIALVGLISALLHK